MTGHEGHAGTPATGGTRCQKVEASDEKISSPAAPSEGRALCGGPAAEAVDHNNIDAGRPLRFDDADSIAYRERALEFGLGAFSRRGSSLGLGGRLEYLYGFALNSHISFDLDASVGGRADSDDTRADLDEVGVGLFHNFNREYGSTPAFALRGDVFFPTGRGGGGTEYRLRGILTKSVRQYDRLHLNLDAHFAPGADHHERTFRPALTLGYSRPLGYPTRFNRTGLAEVSVVQSGEKGGAVASVGLGLRERVTVTSVLDVGLQADVAAGREEVRLVVGYSSAF